MKKDEATRPVVIRQIIKPQEYTACCTDEIWLVEHEPVFTLGIRENADDILDLGDIPVVKTDRGGLITYHGPGQLLIYLMLDLRRLGTGLKALVSTLEQITIDVLAENEIHAARMKNAPGVYVDGRKIASLGLRVQRGCTYHGLSLNVDMDLSPFDRIVPCGLADMKMTDMKTLGASADVDAIGRHFVQVLSRTLGYNPVFDDLDDSSHDDDE
jgi:lipoyl(octanoyl) transferase